MRHYVSNNANRDRAAMRGARRGEEGAVLLLVLLLVVMFTGLGLLAVRHTAGELRSAGDYLDNVQAAAVAEAVIAMAVTDMRKHSTRPCEDGGSPWRQFWAEKMAGVSNPQLRFSPGFQPDESCPIPAGQVPDTELDGDTHDVPLARTANLAYPRSRVDYVYDEPILVNSFDGNSDDEEERSQMGTYYLRVTARAQYGVPQSALVGAADQALWHNGFAMARASYSINNQQALPQ